MNVILELWNKYKRRHSDNDLDGCIPPNRLNEAEALDLLITQINNSKYCDNTTNNINNLENLVKIEKDEILLTKKYNSKLIVDKLNLVEKAIQTYQHKYKPPDNSGPRLKI